MGFVYLHLRTDKYGNVHAAVKDDGRLHDTTLGSANSQLTHGPFAVFKIEGFTGLEYLADDDLERELVRRLGPDRLSRRLAASLSTAGLLALLSERVKA